MKKGVLGLAVLVAFLQGLGPQVAQAEPVGSIEELSTFDDTFNGEIGWASASYNPSTGKSLVFYFARRRDLPSEDFYAQLVNADGTRIGSPALIEGAASQRWPYYSAPTAAFNPETGGWTLFYYYGAENGTGPNAPLIKSQQVNGDGTLVASPTTVVDPGSDPGFTSGPVYVAQLSAAWDPVEKRFLLAMSGTEPLDTAALSLTSSTGIQGVGRFVNPDGTPQGSGIFPMSDLADGGIYGGQVAFSTTSRVFGFGQLAGPESTGRRPVLQLTGPSGLLSGSAIPVTSVARRFSRPGVAYNPVRNEFVVAWSSIRGADCTLGPAPGEGCGIWVQRIKASDGSMVGDPVEVYRTNDAASMPFAPTITIAGEADEVLVAWHQGGWWSPGDRVFARRIKGDGTPVESEPKLVSGDMTYAQRPTLTFVGSTCDYLIAWQGWNGPTESNELAKLYGRRYSGPQTPCETPTPPGPEPGPTPTGEPKLKLSVKTPERARAGGRFRVWVKTSNRAKNQATRATRASGTNPTTAKSVKTCAKLPKGLFIVGDGGGKVVGRTICWTRKSLAAGKSVSYQAGVRSSKTEAGSLALTGSASASNASGTAVTASASSRVRIVEPRTPEPKPPTG